MRRRWFTRRWIVQEVAFARSAIVRCGTSVVSWTRFCGAVTLFTEKLDDIKESFRYYGLEHTSNPLVRTFASASALFTPIFLYVLSFKLRLDQSLIGQLRGVGVHSLIEIYDRVLPNERGDDEPRRRCTMEVLLSYLPEFEATNERDVVFAIASLAKDYVHFTPDYSQSVVRVYKNAVQQVVADSGSLNIMCRPWAQTSTSLPSWILQLSSLPFKRNQQGNYARQNADTLVGLAHKRIYRASGTIQASASFNDDENNFVLTCKGSELPAIAWRGEVATGGTIPGSWFINMV
jgi:hypothetical protein